MVDKAAAIGLSWDVGYLKFYQGKFSDELRDSMSLKYRLLGEHLRKISLGGKSCEVIDDSVYKRIDGVANYNPDNVPPRPA